MTQTVTEMNHPFGSPFLAKNIKVVTFDCDGVMFDTEEANRFFYNAILSHFDKPELSDDQFAYVHMCTVSEAIDFLFADYPNMEGVSDFCSSFSYTPLIRHMKMEPHLKPLLKKLRKTYKTAIATNRSTTMNGVLSKHDLSSLFDKVVTSLDVKNPKPSPDQLFQILDQFSIKPFELLYIGDSETDEKSAKAAGVCFVAYNNPALSAHFHINSLMTVESILNI